MAFAALATCFSPLYIFLGMKQRAEIRQTYNLTGSGCSDYWLTFCCSCCSMIQEEREVLKKVNALNINKGYQAPKEMVYGP